MKKFIVITLVLVMAAFASGTMDLKAENVDPFTRQADIPDYIQSYAEQIALPEAKECLSSDIEGGFYHSLEEIESLKLGKAYNLLNVSYSSELPLENCFRECGCYLYTLESEEGPSSFMMVDEYNSELRWSAPCELPENFMNAMGIMERLADNAGIEFRPVIVYCVGDYTLYHSFNGDERVISIPHSAFKLDKDYYSVKSYTQLPTAEEFVTKLRSLPELDPSSPGFQYSNKQTILLKPDLSVSAAETVKQETRSLFPIAGIAAALIIAAAAAAIVIRKRANAL